ncbi:MAG TPA: DNA-3-methyladenine glycosylase 2 family protein [Ignavibacteria bacterium]|nr:DNA-3-methyladenine glycosylase 2 family protein [Ignavibacteria bacterium]HMR39879.1 DNA-3-methyladenine glycosylase 2 family protein [Ignavibacteria bacterium]
MKYKFFVKKRSFENIVNRKDTEKLLSKDRIFVHINDLYGAPPDWSRPQGFISLSQFIIGQQVSLASAKAHFDKLNNYLNGFTPENILELGDHEMRDCQITRQKAEYLRALSSAVIKGDIDLEKLSELTDMQIRSQLKSIKGIGDWTADIYLMFCLRSKDIFPIGDIAVVNTVKELTDAKSKPGINLIAENWKPLRSLAVYFLWHYYLSKRNRTFDI